MLSEIYPAIQNDSIHAPHPSTLRPTIAGHIHTPHPSTHNPPTSPPTHAECFHPSPSVACHPQSFCTMCLLVFSCWRFVRPCWRFALCPFLSIVLPLACARRYRAAGARTSLLPPLRPRSVAAFCAALSLGLASGAGRGVYSIKLKTQN